MKLIKKKLINGLLICSILGSNLAISAQTINSDVSEKTQSIVMMDVEPLSEEELFLNYKQTITLFLSELNSTGVLNTTLSNLHNCMKELEVRIDTQQLKNKSQVNLLSIELSKKLSESLPLNDSSVVAAYDHVMAHLSTLVYKADLNYQVTLKNSPISTLDVKRYIFKLEEFVEKLEAIAEQKYWINENDPTGKKDGLKNYESNYKYVEEYLDEALQLIQSKEIKEYIDADEIQALINIFQIHDRLNITETASLQKWERLVHELEELKESLSKEYTKLYDTEKSPANGAIVYVKPISEPFDATKQKQQQSDRALEGYNRIITRYGTHTYNCSNQAEYDEIIRRIENAKNNSYSTIVLKKLMNDSAYRKDRFGSSPSVSQEEMNKHYKAEICKLIMLAEDSSILGRDSSGITNQQNEVKDILWKEMMGANGKHILRRLGGAKSKEHSAYDYAKYNDIGMISATMFKQALYDSIGYNTQVVAGKLGTNRDREIWVRMQVKDGKWWEDTISWVSWEPSSVHDTLITAPTYTKNISKK